ncbi:MAG: nucleotidyltransferase domain-containing protein [Oscillospiraceae bacterium]|jgi:predicted nucleotidyltransferase|nr:nucleotidyltransferase domain-containing protein [Oscillospiraceae bacterium]
MLTLSAIESAVREAAEAYPVSRVYLFGSYVRGTAKDDSDVDFYVEFSRAPISLFVYCGFRATLQRLLGRAVDVVKWQDADPEEPKVLVYEK